MKIELFDELFSCYFSTVYHVLKDAASRELTDAELFTLISKTADSYGFPITTGHIIGRAVKAGEDKELDGDKDAWPFFDKVNGRGGPYNRSRLRHISDLPLSKYEKMWLKSLCSDPRIQLFLEEGEGFPDLEGVEPLFDWKDFVLFDQYANGDPYQDEHYIKMFRTVLKGVHRRSRLAIRFKEAGQSLRFEHDGTCVRVPGREMGTLYLDPAYLEYSERDDKFRLVGSNLEFGRNTVNVASILSCEAVEGPGTRKDGPQGRSLSEGFQKKAVFELLDDRNALERFLINFSHYEKEAEYRKDVKRYRISVFYDEADEKDVVIRMLSFGPYVKAVEPDRFVGLIASRLRLQLDLHNTAGLAHRPADMGSSHPFF